ncbi:MAG: RNA polymerase sigma factor [Acidobacteriota bacterium]
MTTPPLDTTPGDPDRGLLERVADGDEASFARLVERHQGRLLRLCRRMLRHDGEAEEAVQDVFLKAYRKAGSFHPRARVSTWLYRIAVNHCLNILRRQSIVRFLSFGDSSSGERTQPDGASGEPSPLDPADDAPDPARRLHDRRRLRALGHALETLPPAQRAAVVLVRFEGLSYRDAAAAAGISPKALESRLIRALRTLAAADADWRD